MICIPATVCLQDLLQFLKPVCEDLELIRIVKSSAPNEYMALLKFRSLDQAHEFYKVYNGKAFNGIEPDICHLVFVAHVECAKSLEVGLFESLMWQLFYYYHYQHWIDVIFLNKRFKPTFG